MNVQKLLRTSLLSVFVLLLAGGLAAAQAQKIVTVDADNNSGADETTISAGLSTAEDGDTLEIRANGPYNEQGLSVSNKNLTIRPAGDTKPTISGDLSSTTEVFDIQDGADGLEIDSLKINSDEEDPQDEADLVNVNANVLGSTEGEVLISNSDFDINANNLSSTDRVHGITVEGGQNDGDIRYIGNTFESVNDSDPSVVIGLRDFGTGGGSATSTVGGMADDAQNTFTDIRTGVQFEDNDDRDVSVQGNVFTDIDNEGVLLNNSSNVTGVTAVTISGNDFDAQNANSGEARYGVLLNDTGGGDPYSSATIKNNNFLNYPSDRSPSSSGAAIATELSGGSGTQVVDGGAVDATENFFGAADGPTDNAIAGRGSGGTVTSGGGGTAAVAFVPFYDAEVGSGNESRAVPSNDIFVDRTNGSRSGEIGNQSAEFVSIQDAVDAALPGETIVIQGRGSGGYRTSSDISTSVSENGSTVTIDISSDIGLSTGDRVEISGNSAPEVNGEFTVQSTSNGGTTFTVTQSASLSSPDDNGTVIKGGPGNIQNLGTGDNRVAGLSGLATTVTLAAATDISSGVDVGGLNLNQSFTESGNSVRIVLDRQNSGFFNIDSGTLNLNAGLATIATSGALEVSSPATLEREDGKFSDGSTVTATSNRPVFNNAPNVTYDAGAIETGLEVPTDPTVGTLTISSGRLTTDENFTAGSLSQSAAATFEGDFTVESAVSTGGSDLSVGGTLNLVSAFDAGSSGDLIDVGSGSLNGDVGSSATLSAAGNVTIDSLTSSGGGNNRDIFNVGDGSVTFNDLTVSLDSGVLNDGNNNDIRADFELNNNNASITAEGEVDAIVGDAGSDSDDITFRLQDDDNSGSFTFASGDDFGTIDDAGDSATLSADITFTGDAVATTTSAASGQDTDLATNNTTITVESGAELTFRNEDTSNDFRLALGDDTDNTTIRGGITGGGTVNFAGSGAAEVFNESTTTAAAQTIQPSIVADTEVTFDGTGSGGSATAFETGGITANVPVTFTATSTAGNSQISGNSLSGNTVNGSVSVPSGGEIQSGSTQLVLNSGSFETSGGNAVIAGGLDVGLSLTIEGDGSFTATGGTISVGDSLRVGSSPSVSLSDRNLEFDLNAANSTADLAQPITVGGLNINKLASQTVIKGSPLVVDGNVTVDNPGATPSVALKLENDLRIQNGGTLDLNTETQGVNTANATGGDGTIVFTNGGTLKSTGGNDATVGNVTVGLDSQTGGNAVTVADAFDFSDDIVLANGDLNVNDASSSTVVDLSPEVDTAQVEVQTGAGGGKITTLKSDGTTPSNDTFNGDEVKYNLAYTGDGSASVGKEAVADTTLKDFEVLETSAATLDKEIQPSGDITVASGATLDGSGTLNITESDSDDLAGTVEVTVESGGTRVVDGGNDGTFNGDVTASGPDASVTITADEVSGNIEASDEGTVTFDGSAQVGGNLSASGESTVNLQGDVTVTDVTLTDNPDSTGTTSIALGDNDLVVQGDFSGGKRVGYSAGNGSVVFDTDGTVSGSNEVIPNIAVRDGDDDGSIGSPEIADKDTLAFDGTLDLQGGFQTNAGDGTVRAAGSTVSVGTGTIGVPQFVIDSGSSTTIVEDGSGSDDTGTLAVADTLNFESGELDHAVDVQVQNVLDFRPSGDVSITATAGRLELNGASVLMGADLLVPAIATVGGNGSNLASDDGQRDLLVGRSLDLENQLTTTSETEVVVTDGNDVTVTRLNDYSGNDVLDDSLSFESESTTYDLVFGGDAGRGVDTGFEVSSDDSRIDSLTVDFGNAGTELSLVSNSSIQEGTVTVNGALQALSGDVDYGTDGSLRDLAVTSGAEILRGSDGDFIAGSSSDPIQIEGDNYTVAYRSSGGSSVTPDVREFPEGRNLALRVQAGVRNSDGSADAGDFELTFARSVDSLDVTAIGTNSDAVLTSALDVGGSADVSGTGTLATDGDETDSDIDPAQDSLSVGGAATISGSATLNGADIAGSLTSEGGTVNNVDVAGDVTIEAGGSLGSAVRLDGEGVQGLTLGDNVDQADVSSLTVDQSATADTETPRVELSGGDLNMESGGNGLTLNGGLIVAQNDELVDLNDAGFDRNVEDGETSHVVGSVRQTVGEDGSDGQVRANFPVGTEAGSLRSYELIFPNGLAETELTVDHVTTDPGTEGLPVEDETGVTVQSTPGYRWEVTSDQNVGLGQSYEVSLQADSLDFSEVPADNFRLVRRGNVEGSAFNLIGTGENYSNFRTQQDGEAQIRTSSATEDITTAGVIFTVGQPTAETAEGLQIAGQVNYPTVSDGNVVDGRALEGVEVEAVEATSGDVTATDTTDADGNFTISGLDSGDYEVTANVDRDVSNVSIGDAQRTVSGFAGTEPFAGAFQEEVADVNASGTANATDALRIAFFDLGSISSFEAGSFLVDTTEVTLGSESESGVSIRVAEFGDADLSGGSSDSGGDASLATTTVSPKSSAQTAAKSATESAGDANRVAAGETFEVPVRVDRGAEVGSYSLSLEYDTEKATFEGISSGRDDIITNGSKEDGTLQVGWFDRSGESTLELTGGSELVTLRFSAAEGVEGAEFAPEITSGEINGPGAKAVAAGVETQAVRIAKPAPDEFALNGSYPNPASQQATVEMDLPVRAQVTVEVYNTLGQRVQTVEQSMSAGAGQTVQLDASQLASGQYFYRVKASLDGNQTRETGRLTIVK